MKKSLLLAFSVTSITVSAQNCSREFLGTKTLYQAPDAVVNAAQMHYQPVFINYAGRHGARHLTKEVNTAYAYTVLNKADSAGELTVTGIRLRQMVNRLNEVEKGNIKSISAEGQQELQGIGRRMAINYPDVFKGKPHLDVAITKEVRTRQSSAAFLQGLNSGLQDSAITHIYNDDANLRFYDEAPAYAIFEKSGSWKQAFKALKNVRHADIIYAQLARNIFKPEFLKMLTTEQAENFSHDILGFAAIVYSLNAEIKRAGFTPAELDFTTFFTCNQLVALGRLDAADDYLKKGPGMDANGLQVRIAVPLLINFIKKSDEFITRRQVNANLRFAHAETISPLATLMGISVADKMTANLDELAKVWQPGQVAPLSANIQWVFYQDTKKSYLVQVLLNEKVAQISGLKKPRNLCYPWKELRAYYLAKLAKLHVNLDDNMQDYLLHIQ